MPSDGHFALAMTRTNKTKILTFHNMKRIFNPKKTFVAISYYPLIL
jgi:hypothetical protein